MKFYLSLLICLFIYTLHADEDCELTKRVFIKSIEHWEAFETKEISLYDTKIKGGFPESEHSKTLDEIKALRYLNELPQEDSKIYDAISEAEQNGYIAAMSNLAKSNAKSLPDNFDTDDTKKVFYRISDFFEFIILPYLDLAAANEDWATFDQLYYDFAYVFPVNSGLFHFQCMELSRIVMNLSQKQNVPPETWSHITKVNQELLRKTKELLATNSPKEKYYRMNYVYLQALLINTELAEYYANHNKWPESLEIEFADNDIIYTASEKDFSYNLIGIFPSDLNVSYTPIDYEAIKNGTKELVTITPPIKIKRLTRK